MAQSSPDRIGPDPARGQGHGGLPSVTPSGNGAGFGAAVPALAAVAAAMASAMVPADAAPGFPAGGDPWADLAPVREGGAFGNPAAADAASPPFLGLDALGIGRDTETWRLQYALPGLALGAVRARDGSDRWVATVAASTGPESHAGMRLRLDRPAGDKDRWSADFGLQAAPAPGLRLAYQADGAMATGPSGPALQDLALGLGPFGPGGGPGRGLVFGLGEGSTGVSHPDWRAPGPYAFASWALPAGLELRARWYPEGKDLYLGAGLRFAPYLALSGGVGGGVGGGAGNGGRGGALGLRHPFRPEAPSLLGPGAAVELDLNREIGEEEDHVPWFSTRRGWSVREADAAFRSLEAEPGVRTVVLRLGSARCGWGTGEEIRAHILALRRSGKRVVAYMEEATALNYYIASAADAVAMQPAGYFEVLGFSSEITFYHGLLGKVGVEPQFVRHGKYKSFEEVYTRDSMSAEWRSNTRDALASLWDRYLSALSATRGRPVDSLRAYFDHADLSLGHARAAGLVDTALQADQLAEYAGGGRRPRAYRPPARPDGWRGPGRIALVTVDGDILLGRSAGGWLGTGRLCGSETVAAALRRARLSPEYRAVVLRVNSGGGSAQASDVIGREVDLLRRAGKPVVASIGDVAASGGYYILCGADRIYTEPNSIVGSIGVLAGKFVVAGLYGKLGLSTETLKLSPHADARSSLRPWTPEELAVLQDRMDEFYRGFVARVAAGRRLAPDSVDRLGQGRIFTGSQALANGLADGEGGLEDAAAAAARLAGIRYEGPEQLAPVSGPDGRGLAPGLWAAAAPPDESLARSLDGPLRLADAWTRPGLWAWSPEAEGAARAGR